MVFTRLRAPLQAKKCYNYGKYKNRVKLVLDGGEARRVSLIIYSHKKLRISKQSIAVEVACFTTGMKSEDPQRQIYNQRPERLFKLAQTRLLGARYGGVEIR
jgi:hypothetical protein